MDINNLTLEQKIGQLFLVSFEGTEITPDIKKHIQQHYLGNFIYFARNLTDYKSIRQLSDSIQAIAREHCGIPAFISTDQEGGMVARAYSGATHFPSNMAITAAGMAGQLEFLGEMVGKELGTLGINVNHAPVVDINNNPDNPVIGIRSYSDDPKVVSDMAVSYIRGLQKNKVMANVKHFPGHGDTNIDSHLAMPTIDHDLDRLEQTELAPFKAAIAGGVDSVMTAHIIFKAIDGLPATLSRKVLTGLLREKMGFKGLIMTDSMSMDAISDNYTSEKGCVMAINAGADLLCMRLSPEMQSRCWRRVLEAVKSGEISIETIDAAVGRILSYKQKYGLMEAPPMPQPVYPTHEALADEISVKSITLVKDNRELLPLKGKKVFAISPPPVRANIQDDTIVKLAAFSQAAAEALGCRHAEIPVNPGADEIKAVIQDVADCDVILYGSYNAIQFPGQVELFNALKAAGKQIVLVSLRVPYDILLMPGTDAYIAAYEYTNRSVNNTIRALAGEIDFKGVIPVSSI